MPTFTLPPTSGDSRKTLEQRAREAAMPTAPLKRGRWPFTVADIPASETDHKEEQPSYASKSEKFRD
jgi:hypothetical protein